MDCRSSLGLALCLLGSAVGCQHQVTTLLQTGSATPPTQQTAVPDPSQIKKASDQPPKEPPPAVLVSWGDFKAGEALAPDLPPSRQQQLRDEAQQQYQRAMVRDPKYIPAYLGLARLYTAMHDPMHAVETYNKALQIAPNNVALWFERGRTHAAAKEIAPALDCLRRAVQIEPNNRDCLNALGIVLAEAGQINESLGCFVRAGGEAMGLYRLARTLQYLNQPQQSERYLALALEKDPKLTSAQAMRNEMHGSPSASVQRTGYQDPSVPPASFPAAAAPPPPPPPPQVLRAESSTTHIPPSLPNAAAPTPGMQPTPAMLNAEMPPNAMLPNAMPPNAMPPNAMLPNAMLPNAMLPNAMLPNAMPTNP